MAYGCLFSFFAYFSVQLMFKRLGENITYNVRKGLYKALLDKDVGFYDNRDNSSGILTSILAQDVQKLNGVSTEGAAVIAETSISMACGLGLSIYYDWRITLVAFCLSPIMVFANVIGAK